MDPLCHCIALRRLSRKLTARYDAALAPFGITIAQYSLLRQLEPKTGLSLTELGARVALDRSTIGRNVRVLERSGLVAAGKGAEDERAAAVVLTDRGRAALQAAQAAWAACQAEVEGAVGVEALAGVREMLRVL